MAFFHSQPLPVNAHRPNALFRGRAAFALFSRENKHMTGLVRAPLRRVMLGALLWLGLAQWGMAGAPDEADRAVEARPSESLLRQGERLAVPRAQGWLPDANQRFGPFWTEQYVRGSQRSKSSVSGSHHRAEALAKLEFTQLGPDGAMAQVRARSELRREEKRPSLELGGGLGRLITALRTEVLEDSNSFSGQIVLSGLRDGATWEFKLLQPDQSSRNEPAAGVINGPDGLQWQIQALHRAAAPGTHPMMPAMAMPRAHEGFEILDHGEPIAAILLCACAERQIWLQSGLDPQRRLVLASLFSALLGRQPLSLPDKS